jgi:hypothetical protein
MRTSLSSAAQRQLGRVEGCAGRTASDQIDDEALALAVGKAACSWPVALLASVKATYEGRSLRSAPRSRLSSFSPTGRDGFLLRAEPAFLWSTLINAQETFVAVTKKIRRSWNAQRASI